MQPSSTYFCFLQALNIMNAALDLHRDSVRFRPILSLAEAELMGCDLVVAILGDDETGVPIEHVTIQLREGTFVLVSRSKTSDHIAWKVSERDLRDVASRPRRYLDNPWLLDFDWLKLRMGMPSSPPRKTVEAQ